MARNRQRQIQYLKRKIQTTTQGEKKRGEKKKMLPVGVKNSLSRKRDRLREEKKRLWVDGLWLG